MDIRHPVEMEVALRYINEDDQMQNEQVRAESQSSGQLRISLFTVAIWTTMGMAGTLVGVVAIGDPTGAAAQEKKGMNIDGGLIALNTDDGLRLLEESR